MEHAATIYYSIFASLSLFPSTMNKHSVRKENKKLKDFLCSLFLVHVLTTKVIINQFYYINYNGNKKQYHSEDLCHDIIMSTLDRGRERLQLSAIIVFLHTLLVQILLTQLSH